MSARRATMAGDTTVTRRIPRVGPLLLLSFLVTPHGLLTALRAETGTAADLTPTAVCDAIRAAQDGDIVQLPAGTAVWSKGWNTGTWMPMKAITIQGAGIDRTSIIDNTSTSAGDEPFFVKGVEGKLFHITGITFQVPYSRLRAGETGRKAIEDVFLDRCSE